MPDSSMTDQTDIQPDSSMPHKEIQPNVAVTPHDHSGMFQGSMAHDQTEGTLKDMPSDHSAELFTQTVAAPAPATTASPFHFSDNELANAFILQEVLRRPGERRGSKLVG